MDDEARRGADRHRVRFGIECETGTNSISNGPIDCRLPGLISRSSTFGAPGSERRRVSSKFLANRVA